MNGYFKVTDPAIIELAGYLLPKDWWSRPWEYAWAIRLAKPGQIVADMGCGWMYQPFKDALSQVCRHVYAVDADSRLLKQMHPDNMSFSIANFTMPISDIEDSSLDAIFCISVLEDLGDMATPALQEFSRCIKDDGFVALTFDMPYDDSLPTPVYPGLPREKFEQAVRYSGLKLSGGTNHNKDNAVHHEEWNLCVFHGLLRKQ